MMGMGQRNDCRLCKTDVTVNCNICKLFSVGSYKHCIFIFLMIFTCIVIEYFWLYSFALFLSGCWVVISTIEKFSHKTTGSSTWLLQMLLYCKHWHMWMKNLGQKSTTEDATCLYTEKQAAGKLASFSTKTVGNCFNEMIYFFVRAFLDVQPKWEKLVFPLELMLHFPIDLGICGSYFTGRAAVKFVLLGTSALIALLNKLGEDGTCGSGKKHSSE